MHPSNKMSFSTHSAWHTALGTEDKAMNGPVMLSTCKEHLIWGQRTQWTNNTSYDACHQKKMHCVAGIITKRAGPDWGRQRKYWAIKGRREFHGEAGCYKSLRQQSHTLLETDREARGNWAQGKWNWMQMEVEVGPALEPRDCNRSRLFSEQSEILYHSTALLYLRLLETLRRNRCNDTLNSNISSYQWPLRVKHNQDGHPIP